MYWVVLVARVVLALPFLVFGVNYFLKLFPMPEQTLPENAAHFVGAIVASGYMNVVKVLEIIGGALVLSGRFLPLGLTILTPIAVNILLYEIFLLGVGGPGVALTGLCVVLIWAYRSQFVGVFALHPKIG